MSSRRQVSLEDAFSVLKAEHEGPWLSDAYVHHPDFGEMAGPQSVLIFGSEGSGKSALQRMLLHRAATAEDAPLVARWRPQPLAEPADHKVMETFRLQVFDSLAMAAWRWEGQHPGVLEQAPGWARDRILAFIHQYLIGSPESRLSRLAGDVPPENLERMQEILRLPPPSLDAGLLPIAIIQEFISAIQHAGPRGAWIFVEDLEAWAGPEEASIASQLNYLLSSLAWFEQRGLAFKIIAPLALRPYLVPASGIGRRRVAVSDLRWPIETLQAMVERRVQVLLDRASFSLADIGGASRLRDWLTLYGGGTPFGWLILARRFVLASIAKGGPLTGDEWEQVRRQSPPQLRLNLENATVMIGFGEIPISPESYQLLRYLYLNRTRACSRAELFYRVLRKLEQLPESGDTAWEPSKRWEGTLDTAIWRLRGDIEWDSHVPCYVVTVRGRGLIRLDNSL